VGERDHYKQQLIRLCRNS